MRAIDLTKTSMNIDICEEITSRFEFFKITEKDLGRIETRIIESNRDDKETVLMIVNAFRDSGNHKIPPSKIRKRFEQLKWAFDREFKYIDEDNVALLEDFTEFLNEIVYQEDSFLMYIKDILGDKDDR